MNTQFRFSHFTRIPEGCSGSMTTWSGFASDLGWPRNFIPSFIEIFRGRELIYAFRTAHESRFVEYRGSDKNRTTHVFKIFND